MPCNITQYCTGVIARAGATQYPSNYDVEPARLNDELLGTLCEKRHDAVVVMDNKTLVSVHIAVIAR